MSFLPEYDSYEEGTRSTAREPERKHNKKKSKGTREVKFEIKTNGYCDDVCQDVRKFIQDTVQRGIVAVPSSITRKSYKYFEGGDPEEINSIYKTLVRKRGHSKDVFNPNRIITLGWRCELDEFSTTGHEIAFSSKMVFVAQDKEEFLSILGRYLVEKKSRFLIAYALMTGYLCDNYYGPKLYPFKTKNHVYLLVCRTHLGAHVTPEGVPAWKEHFDDSMNNDTTHVNIFIFDRVKKTVERFEPSGIIIGPNGENMNLFGVKELDKAMKKIISNETFKNALDDFDYLPPEKYWRGPGIQKKISLGYCFIVIFVWLDLRLAFPNISPKKLSAIIGESLVIERLDWITLCETFIFGLDDAITKRFLTRLRNKIDLEELRKEEEEEQ